jgi:CheY-like chemotaxis protein
VLFADDDRDTRDGYRLYFETVGLDVRTAEDGPTAIVIAQNTLPDVVILDIRMPKMDGYEVVRTLRADENTARIPIVLLSGAIDPRYAERELRGADAVVNKPCAPAELLGVVCRLGGRA